MADYTGEVKGFNPAPGPKTPEKYPFVGPAYMHYGEQPGWIYDPYGEANGGVPYKPDPKTANSYYEGAGLQEPPKEKPGLLDTLGPLAAGAGTIALAQGAIKDPKAFFGGIGDVFSGTGDAVSGMFGMGGSPAAAVPTANAAAAAPTAAGTMGTSAASAAPYGVMTDAGGSAIGTMAGESAAGAVPAATGQGLFGMSGVSPLMGAAGLAAGAYTGYQSLQGIKNIASGEDMDWQQQAALALPTFGLSLAYNPVKKLLDKDEWKREKNRLGELQEQGVFIPEGVFASMPTKGRKLKSLINKDVAPDFVGQAPSGEWVNNKFAHSRSESDLTATDIVNYSAFAEKDPDWFKKPMEERLSTADKLLQAGAVREHHGTIDLDWDKAGTFATAPAPGSPPIDRNPGRPPPATMGRISPGVYRDAKGTYNSKDGKRR